MNASDYSVTFPYGATDPPYGTAALPYHRGDDRAMPVGTPVVVNGVTIGLSGNTGLSTGAHLHIGHWIGGQDVNPNGQGFTINGGVVSQVSGDTTNGDFVRVADADGSSWVYLHLSKQLVSVGQKLEGGIVEPVDYRVNDGDIENYFVNFLGRKPTEADLNVYRGKTHKDITYAIMGSPEFKAYTAGAGNFVPVTDKLFKEKT